MTKKLITLLLALTMVFACAVPVTADTTYPGSYVQSYTYQDASAVGFPTVPSTGIDVKVAIRSLVINGSGIDREYFNVHIDQTDSTELVIENTSYYVCYVGDVLKKAASDNSWLTFYNSSHAVVTGPSDYVYGVNDSNVGTTIFQPIIYLTTATQPKNATSIGPTRLKTYNGWMFRIDGMFPLLNSSDYPSGYDYTTYGPLGASLEQAYVSNGDYIDLNFCNSNVGVDSTNWTAVKNVSYSGTTLTFDVLVSNSYYDSSNNYYWMISDYEPAEYTSSNPLTVYIDGSSYSITTTSSGTGTITGLSLSSGTHSIFIPAGYVTYYWKTISGTTYNYYLPYTTGITAYFTI